VRERRKKVFAYDICGLAVCSGRYLCVEVKGESRIGVSEAILGCLDVDAAGNKCGRRSPSEIVESGSVQFSLRARRKPGYYDLLGPLDRRRARRSGTWLGGGAEPGRKRTTSVL
jgi:hypothetical protein